jgi:hypothetical protein
MRNGPSSTVGGGTCATTSSNSAVTSLFGPSDRRHPAVAPGAVEHGKVELLVGGVERREQIEDLVEHRLVALVGADRSC